MFILFARAVKANAFRRYRQPISNDNHLLARSCRGGQFLFAGPKRNQKGPWRTKAASPPETMGHPIVSSSAYLTHPIGWSLRFYPVSTHGEIVRRTISVSKTALRSFLKSAWSPFTPSAKSRLCCCRKLRFRQVAF